MKHARLDEASHGTGAPAPQADGSEVSDPRHPDDAFLWQEIANDRRGERALLGKTVIALVIVAALVVLRQLFFV